MTDRRLHRLLRTLEASAKDARELNGESLYDAIDDIITIDVAAIADAMKELQEGASAKQLCVHGVRLDQTCESCRHAATGEKGGA